MAHVILVHGAAANRSSWFDVPTRLVAEGHDVLWPTLPGHSQALGEPNRSSTTMEDYVDRIAENLPDTGKTVLVGHSMGGFTISQFAALHPGRVERLIYVAAMLPANGETPLDIMGRSGTGPDDLIMEFLRHGPTSLKGLSRQPKLPLRAVFAPGDEFEDLEKHYILCTEDGILPRSLQEEMSGVWPNVTVIELASDRLPQLSVPEELERALIDVIV